MLSSRLTRLPLIYRNIFPLKKCYIRPISTSKKNSDATPSVCEGTVSKTTSGSSKWQPYGFGRTEEEDNIVMHTFFFCGVTLCIVFLSFFVAYAPSMSEWEQREAFLELRRREKLGLPAIDPNFIDPSTIILPSDEELGDTEIII
ncbi:NADH dehydrogenase [ubiquinone] 1 beta subcomplex subunit NP15.6 [Lycorma delicatula]|uniref:NADH dehydrogenase [ubiquinone] 1 beta subcomplex subunit NP15.6 n=1 Tax=Lycorma delicatula TaxID=130591 RepID=UPI003F511CD6